MLDLVERVRFEAVRFAMHPGRCLAIGRVDKTEDLARILVRQRRTDMIGSMIRVGSIVIRVDDLSRQREFWSAALDYVPRDETSDDFALLSPRDGIGPNLSLDQVRSNLQVPPRIHLDLYAEDQAAEVRRLIALGATEVQWDKRPADADYIILADPEGNRFCVIDGGERTVER